MKNWEEKTYDQTFNIMKIYPTNHFDFHHHLLSITKQTVRSLTFYT